MRPEGKTKSRAKLYNAIEGANQIVGAAGANAIGSIEFANIPLVTETVTIGDYVFGFKVGAAEAAGTSAGTAADPHLCSVDTSLDAVGTSLAAQILLETATTGAWGYLYPVDSVGVDWTTDTLTLNFWPGVGGNAVTLAGSAGDETIVQPVTASLGNQAPTLRSDYSVNILDTTGLTNTKEYYHMIDGTVEGQICKVALKDVTGGATPAIIGKMSDTSGADDVEALFTTAEPGMYASFMWIDGEWHLHEEGFGTALTIIDAAGA